MLASSARPNFLLILMDDMGIGDVPCVQGGSTLVSCEVPSWGHPFAEMPALSRLQREGTRFTQAYTQGLTCSPSRAALMTGLWPVRTTLGDPAVVGLGRRPTVAGLLQQAGYRTASFGKWNIGSDTVSPMGKDLYPPAGTYGFETIQGSGKPLQLPCASLRSSSACRLEPRRCAWNGSKNNATCGDATQPAPQAGRALSEAHQTWWGRDDAFFTAAIAWLHRTERVAPRRPFYLHVWPVTPHRPVPRRWSWLAKRLLPQLKGLDETRPGMQEKIRRHRKECFGWSMLGRRTERANGTGSPERRHGAGQIAGHGREHSIPCSAAVEKGKSEGLVEEGLAAYLGELYGMDRGMGRLFAALDALQRTNDTVTLFTSDHGPEKKLAGEMGYTGLARGYKTSTLEGGIRLPYVLRWPNGGVPPGRVDGASVISNVDWLPTVLRLAKVAASGRRWGGDGVDVLPHWLGRTGALPHRKPLFWSSTSWRKMVVRVGPWKLTGVERERPACNSSGIAGLPLRLFTAAELNELKLLNGTSCTRLGLASLYHIDRDPAEERNLLEMLIAPPPAADARLAEHVASAARRCVRLVSTEYRPLLKLEGAYSPLGSVKRML